MTPEAINTIAETFSEYRDAKVLTLRGENIVKFARVMLELWRQEGPEPFDKQCWPDAAARILFGEH